MTGAHHIVIAVLVRDGEVLLCHRNAHRDWYPDVWDLPGGHVEPGEDPARALRRELAEELGIQAVPGHEPWLGVLFDDVEADVWALDTWHGTPTNAAPEEHDAIAWFSPDDIVALEIAHPTVLDLCRLALEPD